MIGEVRLENAKQSHQPHEKAVVERHGSRRRFPPSRSVLEIVAGSPNGYPDAQNRRSYGECRFRGSCPRTARRGVRDNIMKKLLMATDLSARSDRALQRALALAHQLGATLEVVHTVNDLSLIHI